MRTMELTNETETKQAMSKDQAMMAVVFTTFFSFVGIFAIYYQVKQLTKTISRLRGKENQPKKQLTSNDIRNVHDELRNEQEQSYQDMSRELENMRGLQREVKEKLTRMQDMVKASKGKKGKKVKIVEASERDKQA